MTTKFVESVPEGADAERVIRELAQSGNKLIFTTSFGYMNPTIKVAKQFPNTDFEHATGYKTAKNVGIYNARFYEGRYLAGIVAGKMTKIECRRLRRCVSDSRGGAWASMRSRAACAARQSEGRGAKSSGSTPGSIPGVSARRPNTLISQGADVLTHHTDSTAVVQAAEAKKVYAVAYHSDMSKYGPNAQLTAVTHQWGAYYTKAAQRGDRRNVEAGQRLGRHQGRHDQDGRVQSGGAQGRSGSRERKTAVAIGAGKFHPFAGPGQG